MTANIIRWILPVLLLSSACSSTDGSLYPPAGQDVRVSILGPDGTVELEPTTASALTESGWFFSHENLHAVVDVSGSGCVTATTLHGPWWDSLTFTGAGATFDPDHAFTFSAADPVTDESRRRELRGGTLTVVEQSATALELQIDGGIYCPDIARGEPCAAQTAPFWMRLEGSFISPNAPDPDAVSADPEVLDPSTGDPLCAAERETFDSGSP